MLYAHLRSIGYDAITSIRYACGTPLSFSDCPGTAAHAVSQRIAEAVTRDLQSLHIDYTDRCIGDVVQILRNHIPLECFQVPPPIRITIKIEA